ncbi:MAG TPA: class I SAM-dependent methyltransferase [Gemmatimonadales bacterium]|nr:class I SAM-dependent methyltransferase [Gemmatimonadales bacterium]
MAPIDPCFGPGVSTIAVPLSHADETASPRVHRMWAAGRDERIAAGYRDEAERFVSRLRLQAGERVLDAACGSGTATLPAARAGAEVTGVDLVASALHTAGTRAAGEELAPRLERASVESLPYPDASFDVVLSLFGVMFAARPDRVLAELARVTRPGGRMALASWSPGGFMGALHGLLTGPIPITFDVPDPLRWGDANAVREWLDGEWEVRTETRVATLRYPHTAAGTAELFRTAYPPAVRAFEMLGEDNRAVLAGELAGLWIRSRRSGTARTEVEAEYLEVVATRR